MEFPIPSINNLSYLNLSNNLLPFLNQTFLHGFDDHMSANFIIDFSGNPFVCTCALQDFATWLRTTSVTVIKKEYYLCLDVGMKRPILSLNISSLCPTIHNIALLTSITLVVTMLGSSIVFLVISRFNKKLRLTVNLLRWRIKRCCTDKAGPDKQKCYIIYNDTCKSDRQFVCVSLLELVEEEMGIKLFIWDRDSIVGMDVVENIVEGMMPCQNIIIILSNGLFHSDVLPEESDTPLSDIVEQIQRTEDLESLTTPTFRSLCDSSDNSIEEIEVTLPDIDHQIPHTEDPARLETPSCMLVQTDCFCSCCKKSPNNKDLQNKRRGAYNEWVDFQLMTAMRLMKNKRICIIKHGEIGPDEIEPKWRQLLFSNQYLSTIPLINASSPRFPETLKIFFSNDPRF